eukprot:m.13078 g.13078  ORF g.13078 m.13078 type:complete len:343 (-) comp4787_c0_seq1:71-1099(-)
MKLQWSLLANAICICTAQLVDMGEGPVYERHSVKKPFFSGDGFSIPNWEFGGNTVVTDECIRLTPDRQAKKGNLWNHKAWEKDTFMMTVEFKVHGQGKSLFGDGFALWYTKAIGGQGTALGNTEVFQGMGIFFDTYDNHQEPHGHPWISALLNDGSKVYDHDEDGKSHTTGGCQSFFRNSDERTYVRIIYRREYHTLEVYTNLKGTWEECFITRDVFLDSGGFFGATASTGDLADNHDIISIKIQDPMPASADFIKTSEEYNKNSPVTSVNIAKRMAEEAKKFKMDPKKVISNHRPIPDETETEGGSAMTIILIILVLAVVGGAVYYFATQKKERDPSSFGF